MRGLVVTADTNSLWLVCFDQCDPFPRRLFRDRDEALRYLGNELVRYWRCAERLVSAFVDGALVEFDAETGEVVNVVHDGPELREMVHAALPDLPRTKAYDPVTRKILEDER